jgi:N-acetylmuramoyl-L-alanine amidase
MKIIEEQYKWARTNFTIQEPDAIVIHHALSPNCAAQDIHKWHLANDWKGIAYHYFIRKDGTIYRGRQERQVGGGLYGSENNGKIQICLEGCYTDYKNLTEKTVPEAQLTALIWLCNDIKTRWDIKVIKKHADYPSAKSEGKDCPGKYFPWERFMNQLSNPVAEYKVIIQKHCNFSNPEGVWKVIETHPYSEALLMQWANSYK